MRPAALLLEHSRCSINIFKINGWVMCVYVINIIIHAFPIDVTERPCKIPSVLFFNGIDNVFLFQIGHSVVK